MFIGGREGGRHRVLIVRTRREPFVIRLITGVRGRVWEGPFWPSSNCLGFRRSWRDTDWLWVQGCIPDEGVHGGLRQRERGLSSREGNRPPFTWHVPCEGPSWLGGRRVYGECGTSRCDGFRYRRTTVVMRTFVTFSWGVGKGRRKDPSPPFSGRHLSHQYPVHRSLFSSVGVRT